MVEPRNAPRDLTSTVVVFWVNICEVVLVYKIFYCEVKGPKKSDDWGDETVEKYYCVDNLVEGYWVAHLKAIKVNSILHFVDSKLFLFFALQSLKLLIFPHHERLNSLSNLMRQIKQNNTLRYKRTSYYVLKEKRALSNEIPANFFTNLIHTLLR